MTIAALSLVLGAAPTPGQSAPSPVSFLDVPYIQQSEALCGGAAAAMVMRYWGATGITAESFEALVDRAAGGIRGDVLLGDLEARGWTVRSFRGDAALVRDRLARREPLVALIEDRPGAFHYVVVVAWTNGRVVYHDPARSPFRVTTEAAFDAAWEKSGRWTLLALPGAGKSPDVMPGKAAAAAAKVSSTSPCGDLVGRGVRAAERGDRTEALTILASAADLCPASAAAYREMAGVHALDGNWPEAARVARLALARDATDGHTWRIVATAEYVAGDPLRALEAWNRVGEPVVDLVTVLGLERTRHQAVTSLTSVPAGTRLTRDGLAAAARRLAELPSAEVARLNYTPRENGRADLTAVVVERRLWPTSPGALVGLGVHAVADRELRVGVASPTGGGELWTAAWRWWPERPRVEMAYAAPSSRGVWRARIFAERQSYGADAEARVERRRGGALALSNWTPGLLRWELGAGIDSWDGNRRTGHARAGLERLLADDTVRLEADVSVLAGSFTTWTSGIEAGWRSRARNEGFVVSAVAGAEAAGRDAPLALWPGAGTGHARTALLRAHPLIDDGRVTGEVFGRRLVYAGAETRRWMRVFKVVRLAPALFLDTAAAEMRMGPGRAWQADAGVGLRIAVAGSSVLRIDVARGTRDGATALSVGWTR